MTLPAPHVEYAQLSPMLIVFAAAIAGIAIEALVPRRSRYRAQLMFNTGALAMAFVAIVLLGGHHGSAVMGSIMVDGPALFLQGAVVLAGIVAMAPISERRLVAFAPQGSTIPGSTAEQLAARKGIIQTEVFPLFMLAVAGLLAFCASSDLLSVFVALEVLSLPLYLLCGLARHRRVLSHEAALKYFLLGAFSSAFFLYGIVLLYGYAGTLTLPGIADALSRGDGPTSLAASGVGLVTAALLFKVGAVPFHSWVPDVYQGAPTPITGFMAAATKIATFGAMLRIFYVALPGLVTDWRPVVWVVAAITMTAASVLTVTQSDIKRLLAYSSVANVGFLLLGLSGTQAGLQSTMFYLVTYAASTIGAFTVVTMIRRSDGEEETETSHWAGLGRRSPVAAAALALFLLAIAGIPLTSGFVSKFAIFQSAARDGGAVLVVVGVLSSAVAAFAYARVIVRMFFNEPGPRTPEAVLPTRPIAAVVAIAAAATVLVGIDPQPLLDLVTRAGPFLR